MFGIRGTSAGSNKLFQSLTTRSDDNPMILVINGNKSSSLFPDLIRNSKNGHSSSGNSLFGPTKINDRGGTTIFSTFFNIDLSLGLILNLVDRGTSSPYDASKSTSWNSEFQKVVSLLLVFQCLYNNEIIPNPLGDISRLYLKKFSLSISHTFLPTFDKNLIGLQLLTASALVVRRVAGERDFNAIPLLHADGIFSVLSNQGSMELNRDFEDF